MTNTRITPDDLLNYKQAAEVLGTGPAFVERLVAQRRIAHCKLGHLVRVRRCDLEAYIQEARIPAVKK